MKKKKTKTFIYLLIIFTLSLVNITLARYSTTLASSATTRPARFVIKDNLEQVLAIDIKNISPTNPIIYDFYIANYDELGRSEVNTTYTITIGSTYNNLPLSYTLTNNGNNVLVDNTYTSTLSFNKDEQIPFTLTINLEDDFNYQNTIDEVYIQVTGVQID